MRMTSSRFQVLSLSSVLEQIRMKVVQVIKLLAWIKSQRLGIFLVKSDIY